MGNRWFGAALVAAAIPAAAASRVWGWRTLALVALLALGTATFGERSAVILPIAGVAGFLVRAKGIGASRGGTRHHGRRRVGVVAGGSGGHPG